MNFSYVIPVYNCKGYVEAAVNSILAARLSELEILLVDDGSTDGSGEICDGLARQYDQVRVIHQQNGGAAAARNRGLQEAKGELVLFADADDTVDSAALAEALADPRCHQADLTVFGMRFDYYYHGDCYRKDSLYYAQESILSPEEWGREFFALFQKNAWSSLCNKVFRREKLADLTLDQELFLYEDFEFVLRYLQRCETIFHVPKAIYQYRQAEDEGNAGRRLKRLDNISQYIQPIEKALARLTQANSYMTKESTERVALQLHLTLVREKIAVSSLGDVRAVCKNFKQWSQARGADERVEGNAYYQKVMEGKALSLYASAKKSRIRHKIAVWAKANGIYKKG